MKTHKLTKQEYIKVKQYDALIVKQEQKDFQYCYKPYRTIHNY